MAHTQRHSDADDFPTIHPQHAYPLGPACSTSNSAMVLINPVPGAVEVTDELQTLLMCTAQRMPTSKSRHCTPIFHESSEDHPSCVCIYSPALSPIVIAGSLYLAPTVVLLPVIPSYSVRGVCLNTKVKTPWSSSLTSTHLMRIQLCGIPYTSVAE